MSQTIQEKVLVEHVRVKTEKPFGDVAAGLEARLGTFDPAVLDQLRKGDAPEPVSARLEDIARAVVFLASDDSSHITGTELFVDGGGVAGPSGFVESRHVSLERLAVLLDKSLQRQM
jgi:NAD(P)-dependent dehydrogenase (short-subunit alcohol dehydrogenase family)